MIIFPMAGLSRRFSRAGYTLPKFMLPLWEGYVFDFAVSSFQSRFADESFLFIYRETGGVRTFLERRLKVLSVADPLLVELDRETAGQAESVEFGLDAGKVNGQESLSIFNVDTFRNPRVEVCGLRGDLGGWLEVFRGSGDNWSFVEPAAEAGLAARTAEKEQISNLCCTGLYHFASADQFREALEQERLSPSAPELYVAPIYNHLIKQGKKIGFGLVKRKDIVFCGVPTEYEQLRKQDSPSWQD